MQERKAVRRLVKSAPELWSQCSDPASLARHLSGFGEIRITRLEPESTVAWEGESVSGTVTLEASGWGTRVQLTAVPPQAEGAGNERSAPPAPPAPPMLVMSPPVPAPRGLAARLGTLIRRRRDTLAVPTAGLAEFRMRSGADTVPAADASIQAADGPLEVGDALDLVAELEAALDSLGQAHHRPYSRS